MELTWTNFWYETKTWLEQDLGFSKDLLHVHFGLGAFLAFSVVFRRRADSMFIAWTLVALLQTVNETLDARDWIHWTGSVNWNETAKDYARTLFWPTVLACFFRWVVSARSDD